MTPPAILMVDDEADLAASCARLLRRRGYRVTSARSREEGLAALAGERPDLVVADLRLPDGDGLEIVRAARALALPRPVIVITGFASHRSRQEALAAGAAAFLSKPFSLVEFGDLIAKLLTSGDEPYRHSG